MREVLSRLIVRRQLIDLSLENDDQDFIANHGKWRHL